MPYFHLEKQLSYHLDYFYKKKSEQVILYMETRVPIFFTKADQSHEKSNEVPWASLVGGRGEGEVYLMY